jgi:hypothetical protein
MDNVLKFRSKEDTSLLEEINEDLCAMHDLLLNIRGCLRNDCQLHGLISEADAAILDAWAAVRRAMGYDNC